MMAANSAANPCSRCALIQMTPPPTVCALIRVRLVGASFYPPGTSVVQCVPLHVLCYTLLALLSGTDCLLSLGLPQ